MTKKFSPYHPQNPLILFRDIFAGMTLIHELEDPKTGDQFLVHPQQGHAPDPIFYDINRKLIVSTEEHWYHGVFKETCETISEDEVRVERKVHSQEKRITILNCLDFVYGHSLLKLLNAQRHLKNGDHLIVIISPSLEHLVPDGVTETWIIDLPFSKAKAIHTELDKKYQEWSKGYDDIQWSPAYSHPVPATYDLEVLLPELPELSSEITNAEPCIVWNYREFRLWGRNLDDQAERIKVLADHINKAWPNGRLVLTGFGSHPILYSSIIDERVERGSLETEKKWLGIFKHSQVSAGVHGSNMLLASGLSDITIELLPGSRHQNYLQDILIPDGITDPREALLKYRFLYGNDRLTDVSPELVAQTLIGAMSWKPFSMNLYELNSENSPEENILQKGKEASERYYSRQARLWNNITEVLILASDKDYTTMATISEELSELAGRKVTVKKHPGLKFGTWKTGAMERWLAKHQSAVLIDLSRQNPIHESAENRLLKKNILYRQANISIDDELLGKDVVADLKRKKFIKEIVNILTR